MIDVVLILEVIRFSRFHRRTTLVCVGDVIARNINCIYRFKQNRSICIDNSIRSKFEIINKRLLHGHVGFICICFTSKNSQTLTFEYTCVLYSHSNSILKFSCTIRQCSNTSLTRIPITCWKVEEHLCETVLIKFFFNLISRVIVWEEIFNSLEASLRSDLKPVEKINFSKHHRNVGCKLGHVA